MHFPSELPRSLGYNIIHFPISTLFSISSEWLWSTKRLDFASALLAATTPLTSAISQAGLLPQASLGMMAARATAPRSMGTVDLPSSAT